MYVKYERREENSLRIRHLHCWVHKKGYIRAILILMSY